MQTGITYGLWTLFALFTLKALGFGLENLAVIAGGLSVGIGFGMQTIVNNFLSGLILIFSRTLHEGDVIDVGNLQGVVRKISVRATTVETFDNAIIFVPNSEFVSNRLINWTRNGASCAVKWPSAWLTGPIPSSWNGCWLKWRSPSRRLYGGLSPSSCSWILRTAR